MPHPEAHGRPLVSVLICVLNGAATLGAQLDALAAQEADFDWEVVVADNGSRDGTLALLAERAATFPVPMIVVDASARRGIPYARNASARASSGEFLAFCDSDDVVFPGWVRAVADNLGRERAVMGLNRELTDPLDPNARVTNPWMLDGAVSLQCCNFAIRREAFFRAGGFDESLPPYGREDGELFYRLVLRGIVVAPALNMQIYFRPTRSARTRLRKVFSTGVAQMVVWRRHPFIADGITTAREAARELAGFTAAQTGGMVRRATPRKDELTRGLVLRTAYLATTTVPALRRGLTRPAALIGDDPLGASRA